jgi:hypothetical protein
MFVSLSRPDHDGKGLCCVTGGYWLELSQGHGKVSCSVAVKGSSGHRNNG